MTTNKDLVAFILTHGRPDNVLTYRLLRDSGYTGRIILLIDNEDKTADRYYEKYGTDDVVMFDKAEAGKYFDIADTRTDRRATVFARNACFGIAKQLGYKYLWQLDDDYIGFYFRTIQGESLRGIRNHRLDETIKHMIEWMERSNAVTVAMAQGGEYIGGKHSALARHRVRRKAMNSWLFRTDRPLTFVGRMNDDVNTYVMNGIRGELIMTPWCVSLCPLMTQNLAGGMTEMYVDTGTYMKTFYSVMMAPSSVRVRTLGPTNPRAHHHINWNHCVPKVIEEKYRKPR